MLEDMIGIKGVIELVRHIDEKRIDQTPIRPVQPRICILLQENLSLTLASRTVWCS